MLLGMRIICNYIDDVYEVAEMLKNYKDLKVVMEKDYIKNPKPNRKLRKALKEADDIASGKKKVKSYGKNCKNFESESAGDTPVYGPEDGRTEGDELCDPEVDGRHRYLPR